MFNCCEDCERVQVKPVGTAPERPQFQPSTKYDHYRNFQKFKQLQKEELEHKKVKEDHSQFNPNITDFYLKRDLTEKEIEQLSVQDRQKFRHQLHSDGDEYHENNGWEDAVNDNNSLEKRKSLLALTRTPVLCPISVCERTIGVTFVLSHFLRDHNEDFGVPCEEIYTGKKSILKFDPSALIYNENVCLGVLAYGGDENESSSRPSERGLCINNSFLPKPYEHLEAHLPILIMACQTSWSNLLEKEVKEINLQNPNFKNLELLVLWLASPQAVKPIHCTVTVYDRLMTSSRSSIMQIRNLKDTQTPKDFMLKETNFIRLSHGDINILSQQRKEDIHMEILINEY